MTGSESDAIDHRGSGCESGPAVVVTVLRTGGVAGIPRRWRAEPDDDHVGDWVMLIRRCPWEDPVPQPRGADRFIWRVTADDGGFRRRAELPDGALTGPWRELVDAVRKWHPVSDQS